MTALIIDEITTREGLAALSGEWARLAEQTSPRTPFSDPTWTRIWLEHFAENRAAVSDRLAIRAVRTTRGELLGVAPFVLTERPSRGPGRVRILQCIGADPNVTELRGVVCRQEDEERVFRALVGQLERERDDWDWVFWGALREAGAGIRVVSERPGLEFRRTIPDYLLTLTPTWEEFRTGLSRNIKESLRKAYNAPKRDGVELEFRVEAQAGASIARFLELHGARAEATETIAHKNVFESAHAQSFLHAYGSALADAGQLRVFELWARGQIVASRVGFLLGDALYLYFSGYRLDFGQYSVMTRTVAEAIQWAIEQKLRVVNLSPGNDVSKTRWSPTEVSFREALWVSPTTRARYAYKAYRAVEQARHDARLLESPVGRVLKRLTRRAVSP